MQNIRTVNLQEARHLIETCIAARLPCFVWGQPGVGKSDLIAQIGEATGRPVIDMRLLLCEPTDIKGIPYYDSESRTMRWAAPSELPRNGTGLENAILFLDEMNAAPPSVQGAAYQLILNRRVGEYVLPDGVDIVAAGNRESDRGIAYQMPSPLANRFIHMYVECSLEAWNDWAIQTGVHPDIIGFLQHQKSALNTFDPKQPDKAFATPRSWAFLDRALKTNSCPNGLLPELVAGTVGNGVAHEFISHREFAAKMPRAEDVLAGKVTKLSIDKISAHYSLVVSMCYTLKEIYDRLAANGSNGKLTDADAKTMVEAMDNFVKFMMDNMTAEMCILGWRTAMKNYKIPFINYQKDLKHFKRFYDEYSRYVL